MIALRLVRLIETHSEKIARNLLIKIRKSSRTRAMQTVFDSELLTNMQELLQHLSEWLLTKTKAEIEVRYRAIGARLVKEEVPLSDACWAVTMTKEYLWDFLQKQGFLRSPIELYGELELLWLLNSFIDHALCYTAEGYEDEHRKDSVVEAEDHKNRHDLDLAAFVP
jgi:hypothetical protein